MQSRKHGKRAGRWRSDPDRKRGGSRPVVAPACRNKARGRAVDRILKYTNLALLVLFPVSWLLPLMRAGIGLPFFDLHEVSVVTGVQALWRSDVLLALVVTLFAMVAPYCKTVALALMHFGLMPSRLAPVLHVLGKLAMADIFLISLYIVLAKGMTLTRIETAWGLYLFTACVMASLAISMAAGRGRH